MSSDILTILDLDKESDSSKIIVVKERHGCDSAFITSCVLSNCIKNENVVLIVSSHNCLTHYHDIGLKMNYNLMKSVESELIHFYDIGDTVLAKILSNEQTTIPEIVTDINNIISGLKEKHNSVNIIVDGITHLFDLDLSLSEVNKLCSEIIHLVQTYNNSFLLFHCHVADDENTKVIANLLAHRAQTVVEVRNLASGLSADVSGHLTIKRPSLKFQPEHLYTLHCIPWIYLFKLFDRGVKLLAPGTI